MVRSNTWGVNVTLYGVDIYLEAFPKLFQTLFDFITIHRKLGDELSKGEILFLQITF